MPRDWPVERHSDVHCQLPDTHDRADAARPGQYHDLADADVQLVRSSKRGDVFPLGDRCARQPAPAGLLGGNPGMRHRNHLFDYARGDAVGGQRELGGCRIEPGRRWSVEPDTDVHRQEEEELIRAAGVAGPDGPAPDHQARRNNENRFGTAR